MTCLNALEMSIHPGRIFAYPAVFVASAVLAQAHPGHDDGHELTWDFRHLVENPGATVICLLLLAAAGWAVGQGVRRQSELRTQSLRASQRSRGK